MEKALSHCGKIVIISGHSNTVPKLINLFGIKDEIKRQVKGFNGKIIFPEHHMSHAAHAFYTSTFDESAILTIDGVGEWSTTSFGYGKNNSIKLSKGLQWPHSILCQLYQRFA